MKIFAAVEAVRAHIPPDWRLVELKRMARLKETQNVNGSAELLSLRNTGELTPRGDEVQPPSVDYIPRYWLVDEGDLVVNPMWLAGGAIGVSCASGAVSPDYRVYELSAALEPRFIHHLLRSAMYHDQYRLLMRAETTFDRRVTKEDFSGLPLILPSRSIQGRIADFLDAATARIDALIEKKQRLIELLDERRRACITDAVSRESNRTALRRLFRIINGGTPTGDEGNWHGDVPWATPVDLGAVDGGRIASTGRTLTRQGLLSGSAAVPGGSIVVSTRAPIGYVVETTCEMAFNQGCRGLVPRTELDVRYFRYQLLARRPELLALGQGSTFTELSSDALASFKVVSPPLSQQRVVADSLDAETVRIDALIERTRRLIELLHEHRQALITAAVTGKLDVSKAAA